MINKNELRIGNLVEAKGENTGIFEVECIDKFYDKYTVYFVGDHEYGSYLEDIYPIPLTPEILGKAGFEFRGTDSGEYQLKVDDCGLILWSDDGSISLVDQHDKGLGFATGCVVKYLHQLQNLFFSLTGQEIKLK